MELRLSQRRPSCLPALGLHAALHSAAAAAAAFTAGPRVRAAGEATGRRASPSSARSSWGGTVSTGGSAKCSEAESADEWRLAYSPLAARRHGRLPPSRADFSSPWAASLAVTSPSHRSLANDFPFHTRSCVSPF